jgi:hypothetical protein
MNEFLVRSQNKDSPDTWYNVIYIGSEFNFCSCDWVLNGNVCKYVFKVQMWDSEHDLDINTLPNVSSPIIDRPAFLVDLNQTTTMSLLPKDQENLNHVNILLDHVDPDTSTLNNPIFEVDRLQYLHASINKRERDMLNNFPTNVHHAEAIEKLFCTLKAKIRKRKLSLLLDHVVIDARFD